MEKAEKKRRKTLKNMKADKKRPETECIPEMKSGQKVRKGTKNKKSGEDHKDCYTEKKGRKKDGNDIGTRNDVCEVNDTEKVGEQRRKREKKLNREVDGSGLQDALTEVSVDFKNDDIFTTDNRLDSDKKHDKVKMLNEGQENVEGKKMKWEKKLNKVDGSGLQDAPIKASVDLKNDDGPTTGKILDSEKKSEKVVKTLNDGQERVEGKKRKREKKLNKVDRSALLDSPTEASVDSKNDDDSAAAKILDSDKKSEKVVETLNEEQDELFTEMVEKKKKKKIKKNKNEESTVQPDIMIEDTVDAERAIVEKNGKNKRTKNETPTNDLSAIRQEKPKLVQNGSTSPKTKSNKKVRFSSHVEVFPLTDDSNAVAGNDEGDNLVRGKRFTPEEDKIVEAAVYKYIEERGLGEEGLNMVLNSKKYHEVKNCWKKIGAAIPYRPYNAVYFRAQVLFRRSDIRKWTKEECELVLEYQKEHGNKWRALADELGKHRWHVKDTWRRLKLPNLKRGHWSQEEYQGLFDLVNSDLQQKVFEEKRSKHGMLRDNICWTAISDRLSTRNQANCCLKWYGQLTSSMVAEGIWADVDDYRLLSELYSLDASCMEDVDWDNLLDDRSGDVCRKRWNQMVLHIGKHGNKSFAEQVEVLAQRYCPHLLEAREIWDSKPRVP